MAFSDSTQFTYYYVDTKQFIVDALNGELPSSYQGPAVRVFKSDPVGPDETTLFPAIGVNLVSLDEDSSGLGLVTQPPTYDSTTQIYTEYKGVFQRESIEVRVFDTNADERDKLRILVNAILVAIRDDLLGQGIREVKLSGGRDEQDNTLLTSSPLFMNAIIMSYLNPMNVTVVQTLQSVASIPTTGQVQGQQTT